VRLSQNTTQELEIVERSNCVEEFAVT